MNCHYVYDKIAGKVLIPGCWGVVHSNDIKDCICRHNKHKNIEERVLKLEAIVIDLKAQINKLNKKKTK